MSASLLCTHPCLLLSFQIDQGTNQKKASKPFLRALATCFLTEHHQAARVWGLSSARFCRRTCLKVLNHVSWLKTQSIRRWSITSTSCAHSAQTSNSPQTMTSKPIRRPTTTMQNQPSKEFAFLGYLNLPDLPSTRDVHATKEESGVSLGRGVLTIRRPLPDKCVRLRW
jgi:hypothetical protein